MSITTLTVDERCEGCPWPRVCECDRTCWRLEREQPWKRELSVPVGARDRWAGLTLDEVRVMLRDFHAEHGRIPDGMLGEEGLPSPSVLRKLGTSWSKLARAEGIEVLNGWKKQSRRRRSVGRV